MKGGVNEEREYAVLISTAAQGLIQVDDTLYLVEAVGYLRKPGRKETLLGGEDFQIGGSTVLHQQPGAADGGFEGGNLPGAKFGLSAGHLHLGESVVHFATGIE